MKWTPEDENTFDQIKQAYTRNPVRYFQLYITMLELKVRSLKFQLIDEHVIKLQQYEKEKNKQESELSIESTDFTQDDLYSIDQNLSDQEYIDEWNRRMNILCKVED